MEVAVIQLWTLYLRLISLLFTLLRPLTTPSSFRQLRLGFERPGEVNCMDDVNMPFREKINIIGAAPGISCKDVKKRKRKIEPEDESEEEEEDEGYSLKKRRRQRKKQKDYFKTLSEAGSASDMDPTSPRKSSQSGE